MAGLTPRLLVWGRTCYGEEAQLQCHAEQKGPSDEETGCGSGLRDKGESSGARKVQEQRRGEKQGREEGTDCLLP